MPSTPKAVQAALEHVRKFFPSVTHVVYSADGRWCYLTDDMDALPFMDAAIDYDTLQAGADAAPHPSVFVYEEQGITADNRLPEGRYVLCMEGDSNGVIICESLARLRAVLDDTFGMMDGGKQFITDVFDPANWNDHFGDTGPMHFVRELTMFAPQAFDMHIWRECELQS